MKLGIEYDLLQPPRDIPKEVSILNIINPLIPNFLEEYHPNDTFSPIDPGYEIIVDGSFIDLNTGSPERVVRDIAKKKVSESIALAKRFNASEVIFLSNFLPFLNEKRYYESWYFSLSIEFWKEITERHPDIRISLANVFEFSPEPLMRILESVDAPNLGLAFDLGHALVFSRVDLFAWYQQIKPYLFTLYAHSNDRSGDLHLHLDEGVFLEDMAVSRILNSGDDLRLLFKSFNKDSYDRDIKVLHSLHLPGMHP